MHIPRFQWSLGLTAALAAFACLVAAVSFFIPFVIEARFLYANVKALAEQGTTTEWFWPIGYSAILAPFYALGGDKGIAFIQGVSLCATAALFLAAVQSETRKLTATLVLFALFMAVPNLYLDVKRINDSTLAIFFFSAIFLMFRETKVSVIGAIVAGLCLGVLSEIRPNAVVFLFFPIILVVWFYGRPPAEGHYRRFAIRYGLLIAAAVAGMALVSILATHKLIYWPANGPYNLFAGNNPFAFDSYRAFKNGEPNIIMALAQHGVKVDDAYPVDPAIYSKFAWQFIFSHPIDVIRLAFVKLGVLFSPRLPTPGNSSLDLKLKFVSAYYPTVLWLVSLAAAAFMRRFGKREIYAILFAGFYLFPFTISNADPRLRFPLDIVFILDAAMRFGAIYRQRQESKQESGARSAAAG